MPELVNALFPYLRKFYPNGNKNRLYAAASPAVGAWSERAFAISRLDDIIFTSNGWRVTHY